MSCTSSNLLLSPISNRTTGHVTAVSSYIPQSPKPIIQSNGHQKSRRQLLFLMTATTSVTAMERASVAEDIGLFGLRKKIKKAEEEAEEIVKEGIETAEKGIESAEMEIEGDIDIGFGGGLGQAGVVVGAEAVAVFIATSVVNGILGPQVK